MYEQAALGDTPFCAGMVDVELALTLEHERLLRRGRRKREAVTDLRVGRVQVEVECVQRGDGQDKPAWLHVERRGGDCGACLRGAREPAGE